MFFFAVDLSTGKLCIILEEILHEGFQFMQHLQVYHQRFLQKKSYWQSKVH